MFGIKGNNSYTPEFKVKAVKHYLKFGLDSTLSAFGVSKASVFNWLSKTKNKQSLINKNRRPINVRKRETNRMIILFIQGIKIKYPFLGKAKVKAMLDKYCIKNDLITVSESSVGRIVKDLEKDNRLPKQLPQFSFMARTGRITDKNKNQTPKEFKTRRNGYIPEEPGDFLQLDAEEERYMGQKVFVISATDYITSFTFSVAYKTLSSNSTTDFFVKLQKIFPFTIRRVQTDNGHENGKHFKKYLKTQNIIQIWNYVRKPKYNGKIERYNGVIQVEFTKRNLHLLKEEDGIKLFNQKLVEYLIFYNFERPHHSLDLKSPMEYIQEHYLKSKMYWTKTLNSIS